MTTFPFGPFGTLDTNHPSDSFDATLQLEGAEIDLTLWFGETGPQTEAQLAPARAFLDAPDVFLKKARQAISDPNDNEAVRLYIDHHRDELPEKLGHLTDDAFLRKVTLQSVALYPENESAIQMDFSINPDETQYVLCVSLTASGQISDVDMES